jgi:hypothetical protein
MLTTHPALGAQSKNIAINVLGVMAIFGVLQMVSRWDQTLSFDDHGVYFDVGSEQVVTPAHEKGGSCYRLSKVDGPEGRVCLVKDPQFMSLEQVGFTPREAVQAAGTAASTYRYERAGQAHEPTVIYTGLGRGHAIKDAACAFDRPMPAPPLGTCNVAVILPENGAWWLYIDLPRTLNASGEELFTQHDFDTVLTSLHMRQESRYVGMSTRD